MKRRPEQAVQKALFLDHLRIRGVPGIFAWHTPNGGWRSRVEGAIMKSIGTMPGIPDILILREGHLYGLELKSERGRLTPAQFQCHVRLEAAGAKVAVAVGIDEALAQLEAWGLLRGTAGIRSPAVGLPVAAMTTAAQ
jgi:hypothetical protein